MNTQLSSLFFLCLAFAIPLLVLSSSRQHFGENILNDADNYLTRFRKSNHGHQSLFSSAIDNNHYLSKKAADFEEILKPCNQIPASGRGHEYADCVRSRMLLMGRRKRRQVNFA